MPLYFISEVAGSATMSVTNGIKPEMRPWFLHGCVEEKGSEKGILVESASDRFCTIFIYHDTVRVSRPISFRESRDKFRRGFSFNLVPFVPRSGSIRPPREYPRNSFRLDDPSNRRNTAV